MINKTFYVVLFALLTIGSLIMSLGGSPFYIIATIVNALALLASILYPSRIMVIPMLIASAMMLYMLVSMIRLAFAW